MEGGVRVYQDLCVKYDKYGMIVITIMANVIKKGENCTVTQFYKILFKMVPLLPFLWELS